MNCLTIIASYQRIPSALKDCVWIPTLDESKEVAEILKAQNEGDHDFGYECGMPATVVIDGLLIDDSHLTNPELVYYLLPDYDAEFAPDKPYPYGTPQQVIVKGIRSLAGHKILPFRKPEQYPALSGLTVG